MMICEYSHGPGRGSYISSLDKLPPEGVLASYADQRRGAGSYLETIESMLDSSFVCGEIGMLNQPTAA